MQEFLHVKEESFLSYLYERYISTLEVTFTLRVKDYALFQVKNYEQLCNLLSAMTIRNYITYSAFTLVNNKHTVKITLTEKALNRFNKALLQKTVNQQ